MSSTLYVIATPIGNMGDITFRAVETLRQVNAIFAESPHHSKRLFDRYGIEPQVLLRYNDHTAGRMIQKAIEFAEAGEDIGLITDAGTPTIQDPGYKLVRAFRDRGFPVVPIPGPSAAIAALSASGMPTDRFVFLGFLPKGPNKKRKVLKEYDIDATIILYESPQRLLKTLHAIADSLGENRIVVVAREITKIYEEFLEGKVIELIEEFSNRDSIKGEFVVLVRKKDDR